MDAQKVDMFIMMHSKELPPSKLPYIRQQLMMVDESKWGLISTIQFKDPTISLILSIFLGSFGIDCPFLKKVDSVCWFNLGWLTLCLRVVV